MKTKIYIALLILFSPMLSWTQKDQDINNLINQNVRPSMKKVESVLKEIPGNNPFPDWFQFIEKEAPRFIAHLSFIYPDAVFGFLGRDSLIFSDIIEGFFNSIGEPNKVIRVGMSKATFGMDPDFSPKFNPTDEQIYSLFKSKGFDLKNGMNGRPLILVDTVSKGNGRQGRACLAAMYRLYENSGGNLKDIISRLYFIGVVAPTFRESIYELKEKRKIQETTLKNLEQADQTEYHKNIVPLHYYDQVSTKFAEVGYEHYVGAWNQSFAEITTDKNNHSYAKSLGPKSSDVRMNLLRYQKAIYELVTSDSFLAEVIKKAQALGYQFKIKNRTKKRISKKNYEEDLLLKMEKEKINIESINSEIANFYKPFNKESKKQDISKFFEFYHRISKNYKNRWIPLLVLEQTAVARKNKKISSKEFENILNTVLRDVQPSVTLFTLIQKISMTSKKVTRIFSEKAPFKNRILDNLVKSYQDHQKSWENLKCNRVFLSFNSKR
ncbi:MAG: hypothetical protein CL678_04845 [Bdellovibrionaceae bacterium]|nr:hypothetical protein [Pseudobdellovibrionaceae bacterium]|tara:strand:- start:391 stop:1875 length:1485 start_codon:yes stop_codon:yes gene_type:complete